MAVEARRRGGSRARRGVGAALSLVIIVATFGFLLPKLADYDEVGHTISTMGTPWLLALVAVGIWNLVAPCPLVAATLPGCRLREAFVDVGGGTAVANTVPGGSAIGIAVNWAMFDSWGFGRQEIGLSLTLSGVCNNLAKLALPVLSLALMAGSGKLRTAFVPAAVIGVAILAAVLVVLWLVLRSDLLAAKVGTALGRVVRALHLPVGRDQDWATSAVEFRHLSVDIVRARWLALIATTLVNHLTLWLVLLVAVRAAGVGEGEISWIEVLAAFSFVRLLTAIPFTPGGLGVVELGLTAALASGTVGSVPDRVAAAVLVYRALTYLLPIPVGIGCYLFWRANRSWRRPAGDRAVPVREPQPAN